MPEALRANRRVTSARQRLDVDDVVDLQFFFETLGNRGCVRVAEADRA